MKVSLLNVSVILYNCIRIIKFTVYVFFVVLISIYGELKCLVKTTRKNTRGFGLTDMHSKCTPFERYVLLAVRSNSLFICRSFYFIAFFVQQRRK